MRVIAGSWRGRRLRAGKGRAVRPTTDRVKEAMFAVLARAVRDASCVDLCCGAGGLGIEALSRGAREVVFVDRDPRSLVVTHDNLLVCGAEVGSYRLARNDARRWLARVASRPAHCPEIVLADPPYGTGLAEDLLAGMVALIGVGLRAGVLEHAVDMACPRPTGFRLETRRFGNTALTFIWSTRGSGRSSREELP